MPSMEAFWGLGHRSGHRRKAMRPRRRRNKLLPRRNKSSNKSSNDIMTSNKKSQELLARKVAVKEARVIRKEAKVRKTELLATHLATLIEVNKMPMGHLAHQSPTPEHPNKS